MNLCNSYLLGQRETPPSPLPLRAGPLTMMFEAQTGFVRRVCLREHEVLRGIYAAVRDRNWGTVPGNLRETRREIAADCFHLEFDSNHRQGDIHFLWHGSIRGDSDGVLRYEFDGEARTTFLRNRIGFCVLHPIRECAGTPARQTRVDGSVVECRFPALIEPQIFGQSSFRDFRAVAHEIVPGLWAEVEFAGDVFEMEDQRNWTDASFKIYCTPLALPFPVEIAAGTRFRQIVTLRVTRVSHDRAGETPGRGGELVFAAPRLAAGGPHIRANGSEHQFTATQADQTSTGAATLVELTEPPSEPVLVRLPDQPAAPLPRFGLGLASHGESLTQRELARLRSLQLAHLRVDVRLPDRNFAAVLDRAIGEAEQLGVQIELALHLPRDISGDLTQWRQRLQARPALLSRVLALREGEAATSPETLNRVRQLLAGIDVPAGSGSDANFCELNREQALGRFALADSDFFFWSINPQVHAIDPLSIIETIEAQAHTVQSAKAFAGGRPLVVSPVTLKQRFNPVATGAPPPVPPGELPPQVDPRQLSLFAAAWTLGSIAALATAGAESVTFYETTGWRGVMETERGSPVPEKFPSLPGTVFPVYHVLADLAGCDRLAPTLASAPSRIAALTIFGRNGRFRLLLGNLTSQAQHVRVNTSMPSAHLRMLDATSVASAMREPEGFRAHASEHVTARAGAIRLELPPYAVARLDPP